MKEGINDTFVWEKCLVYRLKENHHRLTEVSEFDGRILATVYNSPMTSLLSNIIWKENENIFWKKVYVLYYVLGHALKKYMLHVPLIERFLSFNFEKFK